jgi:outer membrane biosynthesis protein TonB
MRKLIAALFLTSFVLPLHAQRSTVPPRYVNVPPEKEAVAKKSGDSRSFLQRIFGPRPTPTPAPTPKPTPKPVIKKRPKPTPAPDSTTPEAPAKVTPKARPTATVTPPTSVTPASATTVKPKTGKGAVKKGTPVSADSTGLDDVTRFRNAKSKALEDAHIKDLKSKADGEVNEAEAHKALMNYNKALFQKIREVDPSVSDYSGKVEQSMTKRIGSENAK